MRVDIARGETKEIVASPEPVRQPTVDGVRRLGEAVEVLPRCGGEEVGEEEGGGAGVDYAGVVGERNLNF